MVLNSLAFFRLWTGCRFAAIACCLVVAGCGTVQQFDPAPEHLEDAVVEVSEIPSPVTQNIQPPKPEPTPVRETYSVVVTDLPVRELLFTLARDAQINIDVHSDIEGRVTMNAIDQTLQQILVRISRQIDLRYKFDGQNLVIMPDLPYWQNYQINYVNLERGSDGEVTVATAIASTGGSVNEDNEGAGGEDTGNISKTTVKSSSSSTYWGSLTENLRQILSMGAGDDATTPVVINQMAGLVSVHATQRQHRQVQEYLDHVNASSKRQVLIEVTIAEVILSDKYQAGVDWSRVSASGGQGSDGISFIQSMTGNNLAGPPLLSMTYNNLDSDGSGFTTAVKLLEEFGDTKVLSSPRIMALNNQTALLKVVDERVYFSLEQETVESTGPGIAPRTIITSEINTIPVGFVMSVTPQINENGNVSMNIRPTITRIVGFAIDPAPRILPDVDFDNLVPEIHVNEIESLLEVADGQTVILGGLMQDEEIKDKDSVPWLSKMPLLGNLFSYRNDSVRKIELVIFLRPTVIRGAGTGRERLANDNSERLTRRWEADSLRTEDWEPEETIADLPEQ